MREGTTERARDIYEYRHRRFAARIDGHPEKSQEDDEDYEERSPAYQRMRRELLGRSGRRCSGLRIRAA